MNTAHDNLTQTKWVLWLKDISVFAELLEIHLHDTRKFSFYLEMILLKQIHITSLILTDIFRVYSFFFFKDEFIETSLDALEASEWCFHWGHHAAK